MKYFIGEWYSDNAIMFDIIDQMEVISGTDRNKTLYISPKIGGSNLYGVTWRSYLTPTRNRTPSGFNRLWNTKLKDMYPDFAEVAKQFRDLYFPNFKYSQIQINKNYPIPTHFDSKNVGISCLCAFGDYSGGSTCMNNNGIIIKNDARLKPLQFNGSIYEHWVEPFEGKRYSLVFFNNIKNRPEILI